MARAGSNVFWSGLEAVTSAGLSFVSAFLVARIVGPHEVGIGAAVVSLHVLLWVVVNALFADALVQALTLDDDTIASAFWASSLVGGIAALIQAAFALPLNAALHDPRLVAMSILLALPLPLVGAAGAAQGLLTRRQAYRVLAGRAIIGQGLGTIAGVGAAAAGAGAWALVLQQLTTSTVGALSLLLRAHAHPRPVIRPGLVASLLRTALPLTASTLVQHGRYRVFVLLIGATAGATALGQVHMAFRLVDSVRDLASTALWRLMLPVLSRQQQNLSHLRAGADRFLALSGLVLFPAIGAMFAVMPPLIVALLGPAWRPSGEATLPLILLMAWTFLGFPAGAATVARGRAIVFLHSNSIAAILLLALVWLIQPATPPSAAWLWFAAQILASPYGLLMTARAMQIPPGRQFLAGLPALALSTIATIAALFVPQLIGRPASPASLIAASLAIGAIVYLTGATLLLRTSVHDALRAAGLSAKTA